MVTNATFRVVMLEIQQRQEVKDLRAAKEKGLSFYKSRHSYAQKDLTSLLAWYHDEVARDSAAVMDNDDSEVDQAVKETHIKVKHNINNNDNITSTH